MSRIYVHLATVLAFLFMYCMPSEALSLWDIEESCRIRVVANGPSGNDYLTKVAAGDGLKSILASNPGKKALMMIVACAYSPKSAEVGQFQYSCSYFMVKHSSGMTYPGFPIHKNEVVVYSGMSQPVGLIFLVDENQSNDYTLYYDTHLQATGDTETILLQIPLNGGQWSKLAPRSSALVSGRSAFNGVQSTLLWTSLVLTVVGLALTLATLGN